MTDPIYDRDELVAICEAALVPKDRWRDRDSYGAQKGVATAWMLLRTGHDFTVLTRPEGETGRGCFTDDRTIWLEIGPIRGFMAVELGMEDGAEDELIYLPTRERLAKVDGGDWY